MTFEEEFPSLCKGEFEIRRVGFGTMHYTEENIKEFCVDKQMIKLAFHNLMTSTGTSVISKNKEPMAITMKLDDWQVFMKKLRLESDGE